MKEPFYVTVETFKFKAEFKIEKGQHVEHYQNEDYSLAKEMYEKFKKKYQDIHKKKKINYKITLRNGNDEFDPRNEYQNYYEYKYK